MNESESCVPPGFRFHPTEEELVGFYLKKKVNSFKFDIDVITDIDLYRIEPWDIQDKCKLGYAEQNEWYFFSYKDRKYPSGTRTNRATRAGFWKATGRDKAVLSNNNIIGMRKTLVFYKGRAPNGNKSDWIMHEYRLQYSLHAPPHQEEGWVVCRAFKKPSPSHTRQGFGAWNHPNNNYHYYMRDNNRYNNDHHARSISSISNPTNTINQVNNNLHLHQQIRMQPFGNFEQELISNNNNNHNAIDLIENQLMIDLPRLDSPSLSTSLTTTKEVFDHQQINNEDYEIGAPGTKALVTTADNNGNYEIEKNNQGNNSSTKWEILDSFLASQIQETTPPSYSSNPQSLRLVPCDYELDAQNQSSSYLGCFNNL